jgi:type II secretory pathway component PulM
MKISKRDRKVLWFGGALTVMILGVVYGLLPLYESMGAAEGDLGQQELNLAQRVRAISSQDLYAAQDEQLDSELDRLRSQLLDASDPAVAQSQLENMVRALAEQNGVMITRSTPLQGKKLGDKYSKITLQVNVQSGMAELSDFLYAMAVNPKYLEVEDFNITSISARGEIRLQPRLNVSAIIRVKEG